MLFFIIFITIPPAAAKTTTWELNWNDNNNLEEKVVIPTGSVALEPEDWQCASIDEGTVFKRSVKDWESYNQLNDKLPVEVTVRDFLLFKVIYFDPQEFTPEPDTVAGLVGDEAVDLSISIPGLIRAGSADKVKQVTAVWHLKNLNELSGRGKMLRVDTFDGFLLGLAIIILGILIIGLVFMSRIRKTHKLIEAEYSLENLTLPTEEQSEEIK